jgi:hypothetical protein
MRVLRWGGIAVGLAGLLGLAGCTLTDPSDLQFQRAVASVRQVSGVKAVSGVHVDLHTANVVIPANDDAVVLLAVRDRIDKRLSSDGLSDFTLDFTIARGMDRISLAAPASQYAYLERLRHRTPVIAVHLIPMDPDTGGPRVVVLVATKSEVEAGFAVVHANAGDPAISATSIQTPTVAAETLDGRYELSHLDALGQIDYLPLATQLFADPDLVGARVDDGSDNVGADVTVRVRTQAEVPAAWVHYNHVMDTYHFFPLVGVNAPHLTSWEDLDEPTAAQLRVLAVAIASGAVDGDVDLRSDLDGRGQIVFTTSSLADREKLNALALAHPEFRREVPGGFRVYWNHGAPQPESWNFGKPSSD